LLGAAVVAGRLVFAGASPGQLALPLAFAGGAVLASVIDTLAPKRSAWAGRSWRWPAPPGSSSRSC
jgi:hypothetical protein